jgi:hypothetical protein
MPIDNNGLFYTKPTTFSIPPDPHACSFNRIKSVMIEQDDQVVFLTKWDIEELIKDFLEKLN